MVKWRGSSWSLHSAWLRWMVAAAFSVALLWHFWTRLHAKEAQILQGIGNQGCHDLTLELQKPREKATFLILAKNSDLPNVLETVRNLEVKFNRNGWHYPYTFLNNVDFHESFKQAVINEVQPSTAYFGKIEEEHWSFPANVDPVKARQSFSKQAKEGVMYGGKESYHHMCRWFSGLFLRHPILQQFDFYWRVEPAVRYYCDLTYDPFHFLATNNKVYGFVISVVDGPSTVPSLYGNVTSFREKHALDRTDLMNFFDDGTGQAKGTKEGWSKEGSTWNYCHFWNNFEIADLRFFRSEMYQKYFDHLDSANGFFFERVSRRVEELMDDQLTNLEWGDAPVRSLALGLLVNKSQIHYFEDIAYKHDYWMHCPRNAKSCNCECPRSDGQTIQDVDIDWMNSCLPRWQAL